MSAHQGISRHRLLGGNLRLRPEKESKTEHLGVDIDHLMALGSNILGGALVTSSFSSWNTPTPPEKHTRRRNQVPKWELF
jgi:hypothetical protein